MSRAPQAGEGAPRAPSAPLLADRSSPSVAAAGLPAAGSDRLAAVERWLCGDGGWALAVVGVTLLGGLLRLASLRRVALNPFYDAAVRSMGLSWHNLFFGAFDPSASASIDKPPLDLWLQVLSVKVLGYEPLALKAPAVLAAVAAVALLYDLVRRYAGRAAGLCSAFALAVMPVSVLTSRSDTMDSLMMGLLVLCAWLTARACERRSLGVLLLGGLALGLAFNAKLLEALVALPALAAAAWLGGWGSRRQRAGRVALAGAVFLACALSWITIVSLTPRQERPYPIGSTNGSVWNAVFVFNGTDRLLKAPAPDRFGAPQGTVLLSAATPESSAAAAAGAAPGRAHRRGSKSPAGPARLFAPTTLDYGGLIGVPLLGAILLGGGALAVVRPRLRAPQSGELQGTGAAIVALAVWLATGLVLFSFTSRLHQRYLEAFTPAVAAALGVGVVVLGARVHRVRALAVLLCALVLSALEVVVVVGTGSIELLGAVGAVALTLVVVVAALVAVAQRRRSGAWAWWWLPGLVTLGAAGALFAFPVARDVRLIRDHSSDEAAAPLFPPQTTARLSAFLRAHQGAARYEFAAASPSIAAPVLTRDVRPIRLLTTNQARALTTLAQLQSDIAAGQVRFVLTRGRCPAARANPGLTACSPTLNWVRAHGHDVTAGLGLSQRSGLLYAFGRA